MTIRRPGDDGWVSRLVPAPDVGTAGGFGASLRAFHRWQIGRWPRLDEATRALAEVRTRELSLGSRNVTLQWNPGRVTSTTARVDRASLEARPCFLCPGNLPPEEYGVAFGDSLVLLANPAPIAPLHLVAALRDHRPQRLEPVLDDAIALATATAGHLTVFYNGPRCGASAPDHLHLQAIESRQVPDEGFAEALWATDAAPPTGCRSLTAGPELRVWACRGARRVLTVLRGSPAGVARGVRLAMAALSTVAPGGEESPVNLLLGSDSGEGWALLYPRGAHRPSCYGVTGSGGCLISPGALDMAGLVIAVRREDFDGVERERMSAIFEETSLPPRRADDYEEELERRLNDG